MIKNNKKGFSLIEAMLSLVILSVVLVMTASLITKKIDFKHHDGVIYTYQNSNATNPCYVLNKDATAYVETNDCTEYIFEVPEGVEKINLTLVAGGGGGAGGYLPNTLKGADRFSPIFYKNIQDGSETKPTGVLPDYLSGLKEINIDYMTAQGEALTDDNKANCTSPYVVCADSGKKSSSAIMHYSLNENALNEIAKVDAIANSKYQQIDKKLGDVESFFTSGEATLVAGFSNDGTSDTNIIECTVPKAGNTNLPNCTFNSNPLDLISGYNVFAGVNGQPKYDYTLNIQIGRILQGGAGGSIPYMLNGANGIPYGSGANGEWRQLGCTTSESPCPYSSGNYTSRGESKPAGKGYVQLSYNADLVSEITPSGGSGGAFFRTLDFPVTAGSKYIIRVGRGGKGGLGGASNDSDAKGGVSTAIYEVNGDNETLVFLVNGGMQGKMSNKASYTIPSVYSSDNKYLELIKTDDTINSVVDAEYGLSDTEADILISDFISKKLTYPHLEKQPYIRLNSPEDGVNFTGGTILRAFSAFPKIYEGSGKDIKEKADNKLNGQDVAVSNTTVRDVFDGFWPRRIINNRYAYIGGLGGFSGLGGKAGCGGYFQGNSDGRSKNDTLLSSADAKLVINSIIAGDNLYSVNEFYEGCSSSDPNGGTVKFVAPDYKKHLFGQAGAGGGAGGYTMQQGTGAGGDGQNGYVMIEWRK